MRFLKRQIDRWAIKAAARSLPRLPADPAQGAEVRRWLERPALFVPPERAPEVILRADGSFQFPSSIESPFSANNQVHGKLFATRGEWRQRPTVVLVHGWNAEAHYSSVLPTVARALRMRGINAVLMELPYHLHRRPPRGQTVTNFISENIPRMLEATEQAVADLNAILHWVKREGSPRAALWGFSLGGWLTGLHLSVSAAQDAAILTTPVSNLERAVQELEFCHPIRAALQVAPIDLCALNLQARTPKIAGERILVVQARDDLFVPADTYRELATAWKLPSWAIVPQSHITILVSRKAMRQSIEWLEESFATNGR